MLPGLPVTVSHSCAMMACPTGTLHSLHGRMDPSCAVAGPLGTTRNFENTFCSQGTISRTQATGRQFHPSCVTGKLAFGDIEEHGNDWDQLEPELDAWTQHRLAEQRRSDSVHKLQVFRHTLLQRVRSRHKQELTHQPSLDVQRLRQQVHKEKLALLAQTVRAENAKSKSLPPAKQQVPAASSLPRGRERSQDKQAAMKAAETQRSVGPMQPRPDVQASQRSLRLQSAPQDCMQMTGTTMPNGMISSPVRPSSRGCYAGVPASSPEVVAATTVQYRAPRQEASPNRRPASSDAADKRAQERLDVLRHRFKLSPVEARKLQATALKLDRLAFQVAERYIHLPQLCMCHMTPPLQPEYPYLCAANCALHRNPTAYEALLKSLLAAYGISIKDAE